MPQIYWFKLLIYENVLLFCFISQITEYLWVLECWMYKKRYDNIILDLLGAVILTMDFGASCMCLLAISQCDAPLITQKSLQLDSVPRRTTCIYIKPSLIKSLLPISSSRAVIHARVTTHSSWLALRDSESVKATCQQ